MTVLRPTSVTVVTDPSTNELVLHLFTWNPDTSDMDSVEVRLADLAGVSFAGECAKQGGYLARDLVTHALVGDCRTCSNTRLVEVVRPHHKHPELVRCPDCGDRFDNPPPIPVVRDPKVGA